MPGNNSKSVFNVGSLQGAASGVFQPGDTFLAADINKVLKDVSDHREELAGVEKRLETKQRGLFEAGIEVMSKRLKEAEERNADLERQLAKKDEQLEKLVDIVINKLGGAVE